MEQQPTPAPVSSIRRTVVVLLIGFILGVPLGFGSTKLFPDARDRKIAQLKGERDQAACERDAWKSRYNELPPGINDMNPNEIVMLFKAALQWQAVSVGLKHVSEACLWEVADQTVRAEGELRQQCDGQDDNGDNNDDGDPDTDPDTNDGTLPVTPPASQPLKLEQPAGLEAIPLTRS